MLKIKPKCCLKQNQTPVWNTYSRTRNQSGTLLAEPDTCLEHCKESNNNYTNYSSGHPTSADPLPLPPYNLHFRLNFDYFFLPDPTCPPFTGCHKCMASYVTVIQGSKKNALSQIFDRVLNMPLVLKQQGYRKFCVICILEIHGILNMPQVLNKPRFCMCQEF